MMIYEDEHYNSWNVLERDVYNKALWDRFSSYPLKSLQSFRSGPVHLQSKTEIPSITISAHCIVHDEPS